MKELERQRRWEKYPRKYVRVVRTWKVMDVPGREGKEESEAEVVRQHHTYSVRNKKIIIR